jgi:hypothetical protein
MERPQGSHFLISNWAARHSPVAVILARSPKETVEEFLAGTASMPEAVQQFVLVTVVVTIAKEAGAMRVLTSS